MRCKVTGSAVKRQAASAGSAAFLEPLTAISPFSGTPPSITNLSNLQSLPNPAVGARQQLFGLLARYGLLLHYDGDSHAAPGLIQKLGRLVVGYAGRSLND